MIYTLMHYGNIADLDNTVSRIKGDVYIARINLFDDDYGDIVLDWNILLTQGYSHAKNLYWKKLTQEDDIVYSLGVNKTITRIDEQYLGTANAYNSKYDPQYKYKHQHLQNHTWIKAGSKNTFWRGVIHEELKHKSVCAKPVFYWRELTPQPIKTDKDKISAVYRWASRAHWLFRMSIGHDRAHVNEYWYTTYKLPDNALDILYVLYPYFNDREKFKEVALKVYDDLVDGV